MGVEQNKRPANDDDSIEQAHKKKTLDAHHGGPITLEDIEQFQKEALYRQMMVYKRERDGLEERIVALQSDNIDAALRKQLEEVTQKYLDAAKAADRLISPSIARCMQDPKVTKTEKKTVAESDDVYAVENAAKELAKTKEELAGAQAELAEREGQLVDQSKRINSLESQVRKLQLQLETLPDEAICKSKSFAALEAKLVALQHENTSLERDNQTQVQIAAELRARQFAFERTVRDEYEAKRLDLEKKLEAAEADVNRIRSARDELLSELSIQKAVEVETQKKLAAANEQLELYKLAKPEERKLELQPDLSVETLSIEELRALVLRLQRQNAALADELTSLEQAFAKTRQAAAAGMNDRATADQKVAALVTAKTRADEKYFGAMRQKDSIALELSKTKQVVAKMTDVVASMKEQDLRLVDQTERLGRQVNEAEARAISLQRSSAQLERRLHESEARLAVARNQIAQQQQQIEARDADVRREEVARRNADSAAARAKRQLEVVRATSGAGGPAALQEQIESLRSIALCSVCQKNWKDTALTVCGHVFCHDCIAARLSARMRKCPMCNGQFGQDDVLNVHL